MLVQRSPYAAPGESAQLQVISCLALMQTLVAEGSIQAGLLYRSDKAHLTF